MAAAVINWIDPQFDSTGGYNVKGALGLLITIAWLIVLLLDRHVVAVILAAVWSLTWTGLFLWRAGPWLRSMDERWRKNRSR
jgi:hypothetical protein